MRQHNRYYPLSRAHTHERARTLSLSLSLTHTASAIPPQARAHIHSLAGKCEGRDGEGEWCVCLGGGERSLLTIMKQSEAALTEAWSLPRLYLFLPPSLSLPLSPTFKTALGPLSAAPHSVCAASG